MGVAGAGASARGPVDPVQRIEAIDMVRGFALFGVLLVNMYNFGAYSPIWTGTIDRAAAAVTRFFFETKSWRLFALLFGLGFSMQLLGARARAIRFGSTYARRIAVLFVFGMGHALLFPGDVLMVYAELAVVLVLFRNAPPRLLLAFALALLAVYPLGRAANTLVSGDAVAAAPRVDLERARALNDELRRTHPHAVGSFAEVLRANSEVIPPNPFGRPLGLQSGLGFLGMFLLGLYIGRRRIVEDVERHALLVRRGALWGLALGALLMAVERSVASGLDAGSAGTHAALALVGDLAFTYGSTALAIGYAAGVILLARSGRLRPLVAPLGPVGRLALTVYLTQTLIFTTLFYGYGLGLAFRVGPARVTAIAIVVFVAQVVACGWWARRFRFGPAEWLWRASTYLTLPPMRRVSEPN